MTEPLPLPNRACDAVRVRFRQVVLRLVVGPVRARLAGAVDGSLPRAGDVRRLASFDASRTIA